MLELGREYLENILRHKPLDIKDGAELLFVLPERWMSVHEQHSFIPRLKTHPQVGKFKCVDIITQEPLVVGGIDGKGSVAIFQIKNNDPNAGLLDTEM